MSPVLFGPDVEHHAVDGRGRRCAAAPGSHRVKLLPDGRHAGVQPHVVQGGGSGGARLDERHRPLTTLRIGRVLRVRTYI